MNKDYFMNLIKRFFKHDYKAIQSNFEIFKYIGPGLLVTVGFIDPGNWASNIAAGSIYGYSLLWVITLSTIMLIILQHNAAHLGIVTGKCLSEAATEYLPKKVHRPILVSAMVASASTSLAEILGGAIALKMLFNIPVVFGAVIIFFTSLLLLFTNSYSKIEKWIIAFVSIIGLSFLYELSLVNVEWPEAIKSWIVPSIPDGSMLFIMSILGAVVMPHNLFLHSEVIQSRQWNLQDEKVIKRQLKFEFIETLFSMGIGWAINSAMIILAATVFYKNHVSVTELEQAKDMLIPLLGNSASNIFAVALLFASVSSTITSAIAGGSIYAGIFNESYNIKDPHTKVGVLISFLSALLVIFFIKNPFMGLIYSQTLLSIQLPITIILLISLTSSKKIMGKYANTKFQKILLWTIATIIIALNIILFSGIQI